MKWVRHYRRGFTITELLVVIVVIVILVSISVVAYNGVVERSRTSTLKSEVTTALSALKTAKTNSNTSSYPSNLSEFGFGSSTTLTYHYNSTNNSFCVQSKQESQVYSAVSETQTIVEKECADNGLIGWWRLNGNAADSSSGASNGTATNTTNATGQNGQAGQALTFASGSSSNVSIPHNASLGGDPQTFSAWVRPTSWSSPNASVLISKRATSSNGYYIAYVTGSTSFVFDCGTSLSSNRWVPNYAPPLNTWTHLVFTCAPSGGVALYVNGTLQASRTTVDRSAMSASTTPLKFGMDTSAAQHYWNGSIDDVRFYDRAIGTSEATALYTAGAR